MGKCSGYSKVKMKDMNRIFVAVLLSMFGLITYPQVDQKNSESFKKQDHKLTYPPTPIDPQIVQDQDDMTWDDYRPVPGKNWADPSLVPGRKFRMALVAVDFPDQPFVITLPKYSDLFGNPQIDPVKREDVPQFYSEFWLKPSPVNHGQTINGYWMEQSRGKFGITALDAFGPYRMPKKLWEYGLNEFNQNISTPDGSRANSRMEPDVDSLWEEPAGNIKSGYDAILRIYAGYDETGVWQEFGEMKFLSKEDIPPEWGNPDTSKPPWIPTRYVPWTSWKAGQMQWGLSSIRQGENSGTITHELGHFAFRDRRQQQQSLCHAIPEGWFRTMGHDGQGIIQWSGRPPYAMGCPGLDGSCHAGRTDAQEQDGERLHCPKPGPDAQPRRSGQIRTRGGNDYRQGG